MFALRVRREIRETTAIGDVLEGGPMGECAELERRSGDALWICLGGEPCDLGPLADRAAFEYITDCDLFANFTTRS